MRSAGPDIATHANRLVAYAFDTVMVGMAYWFVAYSGESAGTSLESPVLYAALFFAYQLFFLRWNDGSSFGKSLRGICVISAAGTKLAPKQAVVRALVLSLPFALFSVHDLLEALLSTLPDPKFLAILPGVLWWLAELFFAQSDHSRAASRIESRGHWWSTYLRHSRIGLPPSPPCTARLTPSSVRVHKRAPICREGRSTGTT